MEGNDKKIERPYVQIDVREALHIPLDYFNPRTYEFQPENEYNIENILKTFNTEENELLLIPGEAYAIQEILFRSEENKTIMIRTYELPDGNREQVTEDDIAGAYLKVKGIKSAIPSYFFRTPVQYSKSTLRDIENYVDENRMRATKSYMKTLQQRLLELCIQEELPLDIYAQYMYEELTELDYEEGSFEYKQFEANITISYELGKDFNAKNYYQARRMIEQKEIPPDQIYDWASRFYMHMPSDYKELMEEHYDDIFTETNIIKFRNDSK